MAAANQYFDSAINTMYEYHYYQNLYVTENTKLRKENDDLRQKNADKDAKLADQNAELAGKNAEIAVLKCMPAETQKKN